MNTSTRSTPRLSTRLTAALSLLLGLATGCRTLNSRPAPSPPASLGLADVLTNQADPNDPVYSATVKPDRLVSSQLDLARVMESQGKHHEAVAAYEQAIRTIEAHGARFSHGQGAIPSDLKALAYRRMGGALDRLGQFALAETRYQKALELSPRDPRIWNDAGYSAYMQGDWARAEQRLKQGAKLAPDDPRILTNLGLCLAAAGKTDEALAALTRAGGPAIANANMGFLLAAAGKPHEAAMHYRTALKLQPNLTPARDALAAIEQSPAATTQGALLAAQPPLVDPALTRSAALAPATPTRTTSNRPQP